MGFRKEIPEKYIKLLGREEFLEYSLSNPATQDQTFGGNKSVRGLSKGRQRRDFSPLKPILVVRDWKRVVKRRVPALSAGAIGGQKPPGGAGHPEKAEYKYPTQSCINVQFC